MAEDTWRALVVDDEPPIRSELCYLLRQDARIGAIEEAGSAGEAMQSILTFRPDVLFLDIQMPGTSGVKLADTLQNLKNPPAVVFVTAFAEYAAEAFELDAVDYVLKPVEQRRLVKALDKVGASLAARRAPAEAAPVRRVQVERDGVKTFIPVVDVGFFEARGDYARAHTAHGSYLVNESISSLEHALADEGFLRVHRSYLANIDAVHDVEVARASGLIQLTFEGMEGVVPVARRKAQAVKRALGLS